MISVNGVEVDVTIFPDKTSQVWQLPESIIGPGVRHFDVEWRFENEGELFHLCQLTRLLRHAQVPKPLRLYMPYLPYGRQDKEVSNESTFALEVFCGIINNLNFDRVTTLDAHSMVAADFIRNFSNIHPQEQIDKTIYLTSATAIAFPDAGACDRYNIRDIRHHFELITGNKVRDQLTGYITKYDFEGAPKGQDVLIIDDICDGGMTFRILAKDLLTAGAKSVNLYVTHGIFSRGAKVLFDDGISRIFTKDGEIFPSKDTNFLLRRF